MYEITLENTAGNFQHTTGSLSSNYVYGLLSQVFCEILSFICDYGFLTYATCFLFHLLLSFQLCDLIWIWNHK
jgi:hypothetical protein